MVFFYLAIIAVHSYAKMHLVVAHVVGLIPFLEPGQLQQKIGRVISRKRDFDSTAGDGGFGSSVYVACRKRQKLPSQYICHKLPAQSFDGTLDGVSA